MKKGYYIIGIVVLFHLLHSCASMGRPSGGPQDVLPPVCIGSKPENNALNVTDRKIEIYFDELVQLKDQSEKVAISPVQKENPVIRTSGKKVEVEFRDTLMANTTYTIDFSDAIQDFTENNPIENFSFAFSTGDSIDSLQISGIVLGSRDLEPQQKIIVGVHSNLSDSAFSTIPLQRIARTNDRGQFTIRNLKPGKYHLFAINDVDRDFKFAATEDIAFYPEVIEPQAESIEAMDSIFNVRHELDTVMQVIKTVYRPNDILLSMFNENRKAQYLDKYERLDSIRLWLKFAAPAESLPEVRLLDIEPSSGDWYIADYSEANDSVCYWITDSSVWRNDTIRLETKFLRTDTLQQLSSGTDTLAFVNKKIKPQKKEKKEAEDTVPKIDFLDLKIETGTQQDINLPLYFSVDSPLDTIYPEAFKLEMHVDSVWQSAASTIVPARRYPYSPLFYQISHDWEPGMEYRLTVDSASVHNVYGRFNSSVEHKFTVKQYEDYSIVVFELSGVRDSAFIELLNSGDKPMYTAPVIDGSATFEFIAPQTYYARLIIDRNGNGKYDTGNYAENRQPEDTYYYHKKLVLKKNWEITENWDINMLAADMQKPIEIKKNKPASKKWEKRENRKRGEEEEEDDMYNNYNNEYNNPFGGNQFQQNNNYNPFSPSGR